MYVTPGLVTATLFGAVTLAVAAEYAWPLYTTLDATSETAGVIRALTVTAIVAVPSVRSSLVTRIVTV